MNKQETLKILAIIKVTYPKFFISEYKTETKLQMEVWQEMFSDTPYQLVEQALKALICTLKFPPTIADVKEKIALITQPRTITELEAWGVVRKAISYYDASKNFEKLPQILQKLVGSPNQLREWSQIDIDTLDSVTKSNFMRSYKVMVAQKKDYDSLPDSAKQLIKGLAESKMLTE
jgi:hypothetical protein